MSEKAKAYRYCACVDTVLFRPRFGDYLAMCAGPIALGLYAHWEEVTHGGTTKLALGSEETKDLMEATLARARAN